MYDETIGSTKNGPSKPTRLSEPPIISGVCNARPNNGSKSTTCPSYSLDGVVWALWDGLNHRENMECPKP